MPLDVAGSPDTDGDKPGRLPGLSRTALSRKSASQTEAGHSGPCRRSEIPRPTGGPMRRTISAVVGLAFAITLTATACGTSTPSPTPTQGASYPVTVGTVTLSQKPTHIVSLSATATEMLFAIDAGQQVVAAD